MKKQKIFRQTMALLLVFLLAASMNIGVLAEQFGTAVQLAADIRYVKARTEFTIEAAFLDTVQSNAVTLRYSFDGGKFEYVDYTPVDGRVVDIRQDEGSIRITLMIPNYNTKNLGLLTLRAREDAQLRRETQRVSLSVEYVLKDEEDDKTILPAEGFISFTTRKGTGPEVEGDTNDDGAVDIIDVSNIIDWFGNNEDDELWPDLHIWFDFNGNGAIDIYDIAYVARLIGTGGQTDGRAVLKRLIAKAEALCEADYTPESRAGLATALADAKSVYVDANATLEDIDAAVTSLRDVINALVPNVPVVVDKSVLEELIAQAEALDQADYTPESWSGLAPALADAKGVCEDADATHKDIGAAIGALQSAISALVPYVPVDVDKSVLENLIAQAEALDEADYTSERWEALQEALEAAKATAADDDATQDEVDEVAGALEDAINELEEKGPDAEIIPVTGIKINSTATTEVRKGKTLRLIAILTPENANFGTEITWSTSNAASVTVNAKTGVITGVKAGGSARITATSSNGKTYTIMILVTS